MGPWYLSRAAAPGLVGTPWTGGGESNEELLARIRLGRVATPEDIADAVVSLARTSYATGQVLVVDGGLTLA